ncbi:MAG: hypothetical protein RIS70_1644, partial [Planctomycetota bacterium]
MQRAKQTWRKIDRVLSCPPAHVHRGRPLATPRVLAVTRIAALLLAVLATADSSGADLPATVDYNRVIRPILSQHCFKCHGPDAAERKSGLRLDQAEGATRAAESGGVAIVPGNPGKSELLRRIESTDPAEQMPPADTGKKLTDDEKRLLRTWIEQGAKYQTHWAFVAPTRPELPAVRDTKWARNPVDRFILAKL